MTATAQRLTAPDAATALIVVFPALAQYPDAMASCISSFRGNRVIVVNAASVSGRDVPPPIGRSLEQHGARISATIMTLPMFGNRRGLMLPVHVAIGIVFNAALRPEQDRLLITGCYRGWQPGSIDVLAEAFSAIRFSVSVDDGVMRR